LIFLFFHTSDVVTNSPYRQLNTVEPRVENFFSEFNMSVRDYGLAAPHGPNMTGEHTATQNIGDMDMGNMSGNESSVFRSLLKPDDSYDENGTYWGDMDIAKRIKFVLKTDSAETAKELRSIGRMMRVDPLSPISFYFRNMVIPGAGLLLEG